MGWVSTPELVAATCNAGGFGILAAATLPPETVGPSIARVREMTDRPFGLNFVMEQPNAGDVVEAAISHGVRAVGYHRAPNPVFVGRLKDAEVLCIATIGARKHAVKAVDLGADILIAQGAEGGGHTGSMPTSLLVPQVVDAVDVPVVAAGGFFDGRGLVAALALGAGGVAMGTRFMLTAESPVAGAAKRAYLEATVDDTLVTRKLDGLPHRLLRNRLLDEIDRAGPLRRSVVALRSALAYRRLSGAAAGDLIRSGAALRRSTGQSWLQTVLAANSPVLIRRGLVEGDAEEGALPSGQVVGLIDELPTCAQLVERIMAEAEDVLTRVGGGSAR